MVASADLTLGQRVRRFSIVETALSSIFVGRAFPWNDNVLLALHCERL